VKTGSAPSFTGWGWRKQGQPRCTCTGPKGTQCERILNHRGWHGNNHESWEGA